jgi:hypothetical protein
MIPFAASSFLAVLGEEISFFFSSQVSLSLSLHADCVFSSPFWFPTEKAKGEERERDAAGIPNFLFHAPLTFSWN